MRFENLYEDIDCTLCNDMEDAGCPHLLCPHIMENLSDLRYDSEFLYAVENAGYILTHHAPTLLFLHDNGFPDDRAIRNTPPPEPYNHESKPECTGCSYTRVGVSCYGSDGPCFKTDYNKIIERSRTPCPA